MGLGNCCTSIGSKSKIIVLNSGLLIINRFKKMETKGNIIGIFRGVAAYLTLNDNAYNAYRHVLTGDPNKSGLR